MRGTALLTLPATLAHEIAHALAGKPWARRVAVVIDGDGYGAEAAIEWSDSAPWWAPLVASLAPLAAGLSTGVLAVSLWLAGGGDLPTGTGDLALWAIIATWWSVFAFPSRGDLAVARAAIGGDDGE